MEMYREGPETTRLLHQAMKVEDAEDVFAFNSDPLVMQYTGESPWESLELTRQRLRDYPDFTRHGFGRWGCRLKSTGRVIGFSGFKFLPELEEVELGYRFLPEYWGQGLATESARACVAFGLKTIGLPYIVGLVLPENVASMRVLQKAGMHDTGLIESEGDIVHRFLIEGPAT